MKHIESQIQCGCVKWFRLQYQSIGRMLFAVPNGGARNVIEASIMKGEGVTAGVSDLILLVPRKGYGALCIEMKTPKGKQSEYQKQWQHLTERNGNMYVICRTFEDFKKAIQDYLDT